MGLYRSHKDENRIVLTIIVVHQVVFCAGHISPFPTLALSAVYQLYRSERRTKGGVLPISIMWLLVQENGPTLACVGGLNGVLREANLSRSFGNLLSMVLCTCSVPCETAQKTTWWTAVTGKCNFFLELTRELYHPSYSLSLFFVWMGALWKSFPGNIE